MKAIEETSYMSNINILEYLYRNEYSKLNIF